MAKARGGKARYFGKVVNQPQMIAGLLKQISPEDESVEEPSKLLLGAQATATILTTRPRQLHDEALSGGCDLCISE